MKLFNKLSNNAQKLFNKVSSEAPTIYRKFNNTVRKIDNSVGRVGNFIQNSSKDLGVPIVGDHAKILTDKVHDFRLGVNKTTEKIKNNLEKAIHEPMNKITKDPNSEGGHPSQTNSSFA
jgi:membrane-anchored protein YejM (alkaline phosphatase superfamily)